MSEQQSKIIFAGLSNAGKTTIYKATMEEMNVSELGDERPTRGIDRKSHDFLDQDFQVWELGGQLNYREQYLSKPEIFQATKAVVFVVDIQDPDKFEESYQYYLDILNILVNVDPKPKIYVLFHKFDPELSGELRPHFFKATRMFRQADDKLNQKFRGLATSIYSNSINLAVKRILFENFEDYEEPSGSVKVKPKTELKKDKEEKEEGKQKKAPTPEGRESSVPTPAEESTSESEEESKAPSPAPASKSGGTTPTSAPTPSQPETTSSSTSQVTKEKKKVKKKEKEGEKEIVEEEEEEETVPELSEEEEKEVDQALKDATPSALDDLSDEVVDKLTNIINKRMKETPEIVALSIISAEGKQALSVAKNEIDYDRLATLREVVGSLNPKQFFKDLTDIEYRGLGHFSLSDFDIYFARASDDYAIAVLATDVSTLMLQNAQRIVRSVRQGLGMVGEGDEIEEEDEEDDEETKKDGKRDLVSDLRGRLRSITGIDDLDE